MAIQSVYLKSVYELDKFQKTIDKTVATASDLLEKYQFDTIAFSGMSGAAMAFILSHKLNLPLLCVRKKEDGSHFHQAYPMRGNGLLCEGNLDTQNYLIVDDFIATGETINRMVRVIKREVPKAVCVSILLYAEVFNRSWALPNSSSNKQLPTIIQTVGCQIVS